AIAVVMATGSSETPRTVRRRPSAVARVRRARPATGGDVAKPGRDEARLRAEELQRAEEERRLAELKEIEAVRRRMRAAVRANLARGRPATASSVQRGRPPGHAVDGDRSTRWCAVNGRTGQWWQVDLGEAREIVSCRITWENDTGIYLYKIDGSTDGGSWSTLVDRTSDRTPPGSTFQGKVSTHTFDATSVRYVRVVVTGLKHGRWASIFEFEAQAPAKTGAATAGEASRPGKKVGVHYFSEHAEKINTKCSWDAGSDSRCYAWKPQGSQRESAIVKGDTKDFVEGRSSICFVINSAQSRWVLEMDPKVGAGTVDLSRFKRMGLSLKSDAATGWSDFSIIIASKDGKSYSVPAAKTGFKPDGKWHACSIDLADVAAAGVDLARVDKIIQLAWGDGVEDGDTFKLDDLHFAE
ncbi:MAG: discoidin domain-containing protein, partial [Planctomycetota bacterium]